MKARRLLVTWIRIYAPLGLLWIIGSYVLYRSMEFAATHTWATAIRSYVLGQAILIAAAVVATRRPDPRVTKLERQVDALQAELAEARQQLTDVRKQFADVRQQLVLLQAVLAERWKIDAEQAADTIQRAADAARRPDCTTSVHIVRDEHSSP